MVTEKQKANLRHIKKGELSSEEARRRGSNGGKKSAETNKRRKTMREMMNLLLGLPVSDNNKAQMMNMGIKDTENMTNTMLVAVGLMKEAARGNPRAVEVLCGIAGDQFTIPTQEDEDETKAAIDNLKGFEIKFIDAGGQRDANNSSED